MPSGQTGFGAASEVHHREHQTPGKYPRFLPSKTLAKRVDGTMLSRFHEIEGQSYFGARGESLPNDGARGESLPNDDAIDAAAPEVWRSMDVN